MSEIFKTILILSVLGSVLIIPLLVMKPYLSKRISGSLQYCIWIAVMLSMILPVYKLIPLNNTKNASASYVIPIVPTDTDSAQNNQIPQHAAAQNTQNHTAPAAVQNNQPDFSLNLPDFLTYVWIFGILVFLVIIAVSYVTYLVKKRRSSVAIAQSPILNNTRKVLKIKQQIRVRMSPDVRSPMLVGIIFPTVYIPCREISDENLQMVFLHELTHFKRKDLIIKWLGLFVNILHWFNPFAYILFSNLSEACETSCDMAVTKNMSDEEQKIYIKTILELVE